MVQSRNPARRAGVETPVDDLTLLELFESRTLPYAEWGHRLHVRVAYLFLRRDPFDEALRRLRGCIQAYNRQHDVPESLTSGYHETLTVAWLRLIAARMDSRVSDLDSESFCGAHPELLEKSLLRTYYSSEQMVSAGAKRSFIGPDREPLPG
jgi:hypothetical protein